MLPVIISNQDLKVVEERWSLDDLGWFLFSVTEKNVREAQAMDAARS